MVLLRSATFLFGALLLTSAAAADDVGSKLGEAYKSADSGKKLALLSTAYADKVIKSKELNAAVMEVSLAELAKGKTSKEKLELLGAMRLAGKDAMKAINDERKKVKKRYVSLREPDTTLQRALCLRYVADTAGAAPSLEALGCLKVVRANSSWGAHGSLCYSLVGEALLRDKAYLAADRLGKLAILKKLTIDAEMMTNQERTYFEKEIVSEWIASELKAGKGHAELHDVFDKLGKKRDICFFTASWAKSTLKMLGKLE